MKARFLAATFAVISTFALGSRADALSVTTPFVNFKAVGTPTTTNIPTTLNFANFGSLYSGPGILTKVRWIISSPATVGGNPKITNTSASAQTPTASDLAYSVSLTPTILGSALAGGYQNASTLNCTASGCSNTIPGSDGETSTTRTFTTAGTYTGNSVFASLNPAQVAAFTGGSVTSTYQAIFAGANPNLSWNFNTLPGGLVSDTPFIQGSVALQYEYEIPAGAIVPGPVPLIGAAAAFGWSRRLKKRIASVA